MGSFAHPLVVLSALSGVALSGLFVLAVRRRNHPGAPSLAAIVGGAALWSLAYAVALSTFDPSTRRLLELPIWAGRMTMPVAWVTFALAYAGRADLVRRRTILLLSLPHVVMLGLVAANPANLVWADYHIVGADVATVSYRYGPALVVDTLYSYGLIAMGSSLLLGAAITSPQRYDDQVTALLVGAAVPTFTSLAWVLRLSPVEGMDFTPIALTVTGVTFGYALFRGEVLTATPGVQQTSVQAALDDFTQAVVLLDDDWRILDTNEGARSLLDVEAGAALREHIFDILDVDPASVAVGTQRLSLDTRTGRRVFDLVVTRVTDPQNRELGYNFVFHDVTEREQRKQRLSVLNRVLRHNLRNDLNVIAGAAESLPDADDGTAEALRASILDRTDQLSTLGEQAKEAQRVVERNSETTQEVRLESFVSRIVSSVGESSPDIEFGVAVPSTLEVRTDVAILELVLRNAVENAIARADHTDTYIEVAATTWAADRWVDLEVSSNGPALTDQERVAIDGGEESALEHASALDLWLVRWGTTTIGGDVTITGSRRGESTLHLHVPRETDDPPSTVNEPSG